MAEVPEDVTGAANPVPRGELILTDSVLASYAKEIIEAAEEVSMELSAAVPTYTYVNGSYQAVDRNARAAAIKGGLYDFLFRFLGIAAGDSGEE